MLINTALELLQNLDSSIGMVSFFLSISSNLAAVKAADNSNLDIVKPKDARYDFPNTKEQSKFISKLTVLKYETAPNVVIEASAK